MWSGHRLDERPGKWGFLKASNQSITWDSQKPEKKGMSPHHKWIILHQLHPLLISLLLERELNWPAWVTCSPALGQERSWHLDRNAGQGQSQLKREVLSQRETGHRTRQKGNAWWVSKNCTSSKKSREISDNRDFHGLSLCSHWKLLAVRPNENSRNYGCSAGLYPKW